VLVINHLIFNRTPPQSLLLPAKTAEGSPACHGAMSQGRQAFSRSWSPAPWPATSVGCGIALR